MEEVTAILDISCLICCPKCDAVFDLFEMQEFLDDGNIYDELMSKNRSWGKVNWNKIVHCPECNQKIKISSVEF